MSARRKRVRYTLDVHFAVEAEKAAFVSRLQGVRGLLSGGEGMDNFGVMSAMFDMVERTIPPTSNAGNERQSSQSFMRDSGKLLSVCFLKLLVRVSRHIQRE